MQKFKMLWRWLVLLPAFLYWSGAVATAQVQGRVHLTELPPTAYVYVNARVVGVQNGLLSLLPGWYLIQVEKQEKGALQAYRRSVQVVADQTVEMRIVWHPVLLAIKANGVATYSPPGQDGPTGPSGPPARPCKRLPAGADTTTLRAPLEEARDILLSDFAAQVQDALNVLSALAKPRYLYIPGPPFPEPPGNSGSPGPPGAAGIPAEVGLIQASNGVSFRHTMEQKLGLPAMQKTLAALQTRLHHLFETPGFFLSMTPESVQVLTPVWKTALDQEWKRRKPGFPEHPRGELFGIQGMTGAPGPRGPDGVASTGAMPIRVSAEQEKQLLEMLTTDATIRTQIEALREQLAELTMRVYLAEGNRPSPPIAKPVGSDH